MKPRYYLTNLAKALAGRATLQLTDGSVVDDLFVAKALTEEAESPEWRQQQEAHAVESIAQRGYRYYASNPWVYACVFAIMSAGASVPIGVRRRVEKEDDEGQPVTELEPVDHPLVQKLLSRPNSFQSSYDLMEETFAYLELVGMFYWEKGRKEEGEPGAAPYGSTDKGKLVALFPVRPDLLKPKGDESKLVTHYEYHGSLVGGQDTVIDADDIVPFRYFHPTSHRIGMGSIQSATSSIDSMLLGHQWNQDTLRNSAITDLIFETDRPMSKPSIQRFLAQWEARHTGAGKRNRPGVAHDGLKARELGKTARDMEHSKLMSFSREEVLADFGVPPILVGILQFANYANSRTQLQHFWAHTMVPKLRKVESTLQAHLVPDIQQATELDKLEAYADLSGVEALQEDVTAQLARLVSAVGGPVLTANEARTELGKPAKLGGDELALPAAMPLPEFPAIGEPAEEVPAVVPGRPAVAPAAVPAAQLERLGAGQTDSAVSIVAQAARGEIPAAAAREMLVQFLRIDPAGADAIMQSLAGFKPPEPEGEGEPEKADDTQDPGGVLVPFRPIDGETWEEKQRRRRNALDDARTRQKNALVQDLRGFFRRMEKRFIDELQKRGGPEVKAQLEKAGTFDVAKSMDFEVAKQPPVPVAEFLDALTEEARGELLRILEDAGLRTIDVGGRTAIVSVLGGSVEGFSISQAIYRDFLMHSRAVSGGIFGTMSTRLADTLSEGIARGETTATLSRMAREVFDGLSVKHSVMVAETETHGALNYGAQKGYEFMGVPCKEWLARMVNTRDSHKAVNGQVRQVGEDFDVPIPPRLMRTEKMSYPGDYKASFANSHRCNCTVMPVSEDDPRCVQRMR